MVVLAISSFLQNVIMGLLVLPFFATRYPDVACVALMFATLVLLALPAMVLLVVR